MTVMQSDIAITGGGPAGLAAALSLAENGLTVCVLEQAPESVWSSPSFDGREIALTHHSRALLEKIGAWSLLPEECISLLNEARIETGRNNEPLIFRAEEDTHEPLGWLVSNYAIRKSLWTLANAHPGITLLPDSSVTTIRRNSDAAVVHFQNGDTPRKLSARLVIGADGRFSPTRRRAGIGAVIHDFHRTMMVCRMEHSEPHHNVALQWFDHGQTIAMLPVQGQASSLVLTLPTEKIRHLMNASVSDFDAEIMQRTGGRFGDMHLISSRHAYPMKTVFAHRFAAPRLALIGDAAVGMHPITAHGFNLGLRAQEILSEEIGKAFARGEDIGSSPALRRFETRLRKITVPMFATTNSIATLYTRDDGPFRILRRAGLRLAGSVPPFKRAVTQMLTEQERNNGLHTAFGGLLPV